MGWHHARMGVPPSVAVTGASGGIGSALVEHLAARQYPLTLIDRPSGRLEAMAPLGATIGIDLADQPPAGLLDGIEVVVHLAGEANHQASWDTLLPDNIEASYHVASAAMRAGCRRLIVASSVHAVFASAERPVAPDGPVAPADGSVRSHQVLRRGARVLVRASRSDVGRRGSDRGVPNGAGEPIERRGLDGRHVHRGPRSRCVARARNQCRIPLRCAARRGAGSRRAPRYPGDRAPARVARRAPFLKSLDGTEQPGAGPGLFDSGRDRCKNHCPTQGALWR